MVYPRYWNTVAAPTKKSACETRVPSARRSCAVVSTALMSGAGAGCGVVVVVVRTGETHPFEIVVPLSGMVSRERLGRLAIPAPVTGAAEPADAQRLGVVEVRGLDHALLAALLAHCR